jgi:hypothetical protein
MARAISSLPVPVSARRRMGSGELANWVARRRASTKVGSSPRMAAKAALLSIRRGGGAIGCRRSADSTVAARLCTSTPSSGSAERAGPVTSSTATV